MHRPTCISMYSYVKGCLHGAGGVCACVCLCVCAPSHPCVCRAFRCSVLSVCLQTPSFALLSVTATDGDDERDRGAGRDTELLRLRGGGGGRWKRTEVLRPGWGNVWVPWISDCSDQCQQFSFFLQLCVPSGGVSRILSDHLRVYVPISLSLPQCLCFPL